MAIPHILLMLASRCGCADSDKVKVRAHLIGLPQSLVCLDSRAFSDVKVQGTKD